MVLFALLPSDQHFFAGVVIHENAAALFLGKTFTLNLPAVDEGEGEPIGEDGAQFFHQVKGEGGATGAVLMQKTDIGVESHALEGRGDIVGEQDVVKREQGVHFV